MLEKIMNMPKIELHIHLDGSLDINNVSLKTNKSISELQKIMMVKEECKDLNEYLEKFDYPISIMQTKEELEESMYNVCLNLKKQNIIYAEIRFAPAFHTEKGLTQEEVVQSVLKGLEKSNTNYNIILCCMRNLDINTNKETINIANKYNNNHIVAIDLAGAEALFPTNNFKELFDYAKKLNIPYTIHAGEADGIESIKSAISFGTKRIGHGVRCIEDKNLVDYIKNNDITLEICPTSNINTKVTNNIESHPINELYNKGVKVTINTDNMTVSNITLNKEYKKLIDAFNYNLEDFKKMNINSINASFLLEEEKEKLRDIINKYN